MSTRMEKYGVDSETLGKRTQRNEELYREVNNSSITDFKVTPNASVLDSAGDSVDIEKIKEILDTKYKESAPKRKSIEIQENFIEDTKEYTFETKDYDLNNVLEKAKENKVIDYSEERLKKLKNTQYDILKNLDLNEKKHQTEEKSDEENLMDLINTIVINETKESDESDLFDSLKGDENTVIIPPIEEIGKNTLIDNSFYTGNLKIQDKDYEDFKDLKDDMKKNNILIKVLAIIFLIIFIVGIVLVLNKVLNWGLY